MDISYKGQWSLRNEINEASLIVSLKGFSGCGGVEGTVGGGEQGRQSLGKLAELRKSPVEKELRKKTKAARMSSIHYWRGLSCTGRNSQRSADFLQCLL